MITHKSDTSLYWLLMQAMFQAKYHIADIAETHKLTTMQACTLLVLQSNEPKPMNMLSTLFHCDASNVTGIVDKLESHQLIERKDKPGDRRIKMIALTTSGDELRSKIMHQIFESQTFNIGDLLDREELTTLQTLLRKIVTT